jgi:hypothetical protein
MDKLCERKNQETIIERECNDGENVRHKNAISGFSKTL